LTTQKHLAGTKHDDIVKRLLADVSVKNTKMGEMSEVISDFQN